VFGKGRITLLYKYIHQGPVLTKLPGCPRKAESKIFFLHSSPKCSGIPQSSKKRRMTVRPEDNLQEAHRAPPQSMIAKRKLPLIISSFENHSNLSIRVILTKSAANFLAGQSPEQPTVASLALLPNVDSVLW